MRVVNRRKRRCTSFAHLSGRVRRFQGASSNGNAKERKLPEGQAGKSHFHDSHQFNSSILLFLIARIKLQLHSKPNMSIQPAISFDISIDGKVS